MVKKKTKKKTITLTAAQAEQFIRGVQEALADARAMVTTEFFMDTIEQTMSVHGVPHIKAVPPKGEKLGQTLGPFTYVGKDVKVK